MTTPLDFCQYRVKNERATKTVAPFFSCLTYDATFSAFSSLYGVMAQKQL